MEKADYAEELLIIQLVVFTKTAAHLLSPMRICNGSQNSCFCKDIGLPVVQLALKIWQTEDTTALCAQHGEMFHLGAEHLRCCSTSSECHLRVVKPALPWLLHRDVVPAPPATPKYSAVIRHGTEWRRGRGERWGGKRSVRDANNHLLQSKLNLHHIFFLIQNIEASLPNLKKFDEFFVV